MPPRERNVATLESASTDSRELATFWGGAKPAGSICLRHFDLLTAKEEAILEGLDNNRTAKADVHPPSRRSSALTAVVVEQLAKQPARGPGVAAYRRSQGIFQRCDVP